MSKKNTPAKTRQRTLVFVALFIEFLATSIFTGLSGFSAYQKNQEFAQVDAEEKFSRLPEYLIKDRKLLKNKYWPVRHSTVKALKALRSNEGTSELILLLNKDFESSSYVRCSAAETLAELGVKEAIPQLILSTERTDDTDESCFVRALHKLQLARKFLMPTKPIKYSHNSSDLDRTEDIISLRSLNFVGLETKRVFGEELIERISMLLNAYHHSGGTTKSNTAKMLINLRTEQVIPTLLELLRSDNFIVRYEARYLLSRLQVKEAVPKLMTILSNSNGNEKYEIIETLIELDGLNEYQIRQWMIEIIKELEGFDILPGLDRAENYSAIDVSTRIRLRLNQEFKESRGKLPSLNQSRRIRDSQWILTSSALVASLLLFLLTLFSFQQLYRIGWQEYIVCYFPEEVVGELIALRRELTKAEKSTLFIETKLLHEVLTLIWAFYIQINIENLSLPSKDQRRR